jgi:hypothetical protein
MHRVSDWPEARTVHPKQFQLAFASGMRASEARSIPHLCATQQARRERGTLAVGSFS